MRAGEGRTVDLHFSPDPLLSTALGSYCFPVGYCLREALILFFFLSNAFWQGGSYVQDPLLWFTCTANGGGQLLPSLT